MDRFVGASSTGTGTQLISFAPSASGLTNFVQNPLYFFGASAKSDNGGTNPRLYTPNPFLSGSSVGHWNDTYVNILMIPSLIPGIAIHNVEKITIGLLKDIGWTVVYPIGIEDQLLINSQSPSFLNENETFTYTGSFYDNYPYGDNINNPSWRLEIYYNPDAVHTSGKYVALQRTGWNGFLNANFGSLPPGYSWMRNDDGTVRAKVILSGTDDDGIFHQDIKMVGIYRIPDKPLLQLYTPVAGTRSLSISFYAQGATGYKISWGSSPGNYNQYANVGAGVNTYTIQNLPCSSTRYVNVQGINSKGTGVFADEKSGYIDCSVGGGGGGGTQSANSINGPKRKKEDGSSEDELSSNSQSIFFEKVSSKSFRITFSYESNEGKIISIYNTYGQLIFERKAERSEANTMIDLSGTAEGVYLLHVRSGDEMMYNNKILVQ